MPQGRRLESYAEFQQGENKKRQKSGAKLEPYNPAEFPIGVGAEPAPAQPASAPSPTEPPGFFENLGIGAQRAILSASDAGRVLNEAVSAAASGNFEPLKQLAEVIGRGAAPLLAGAGAGPYGAGQAYATESAIQSGPIANLTRQREERISQVPELYSSEVVDAETRAALAQRAGLDPSIFGKITRGASELTTGAIPAVAAGIATGGSVPAVATVVGLQSLGQPENLVPAVALAAAPLPAGKALAPLIRRIRGARGAAIEPVIKPALPESPTALPGPAGPRLPVRRVPAAAPSPEGPGLPSPTPSSPAPPFPGVRPGNLPGPGGPRLAPYQPETALPATETAPSIPSQAAPSEALQSAFQKLGTDNVEDIGAMIANANRKFTEKITVPGEKTRPRTEAEIQSSADDFSRVSQLTPEENQALAQVLPERTFAPPVFEPPAVSGAPGVGQARAISDIPMSEANAQLDANLRELEAFFGAQAGQPKMNALAAAVGKDAFDGAKVKTQDLGLGSKVAPVEATDALPIRRTVKAEDLTLGRDDLSKGRMFQAQESLNQGLKPGGAEFTTPGGRKGVVDDIRVTPDPAEPGKFIVGGDGNHRAALLKLQDFKGDIPVISMESPAQTAALQAKGLRLNEIEASLTKGAKIGEMRGPAIQAEEALKAGTLVAPAEKSSLIETLVSLWKAGMLTRAGTTLRNISGNIGSVLGDEAARIPAAIADIVTSPLRGGRNAVIARGASVQGPSLGAMARALKEAGTRGIKEAGEIFKTGITAEDAARLQIPNELNSGSRIVDGYVNGVFRFYNAQDRLFRVYAYARSLEELAKVQARAEGAGTAGEFAARVRQLIANPDEGMRAAATAAAEEAVFTNSNPISGAVSAAKAYLGNKGAAGQAVKTGLDILVPFDRTPTNILIKTMEFSPVGLIGSPLRAAVKKTMGQAFTPAEERAFLMTFGRGAVGTAAMVVGWKLASRGLMTGLYEDEPSKISRDIAAGRTPGAVRVGDGWHQIAGTGPLGNLMAIGASLEREAAQERTPQGRQFPEAAYNIVKSTVEQQPLLQGLSALSQPGNVSERAGRFVGSAVPGAVSDVAQMFDVRRQTKGEGFAAQIEARIPGLSQNLPPAVDALGRPLEDRFSRFIDPTMTSTARELREPLIAELIRLDMGLLKLQKKPSESSDVYLNRVRKFGTAYESEGLKLLNNPSYQSASDKDKRVYFTRLASSLRDAFPAPKER